MSINEIAKHLKVSKSTVSLVINGKAEQARISQSLAKRILDYVEEIGYKPNALAKSLATGRSNTIGLIVENIGDSFFGPIALYIEEYLRPYGYHVLYSSTLGDLDLARTILTAMVDKKLEGLILAPAMGQEDQVLQLLGSKTPLVIFDRRIPQIPTNYVGTDNYTASKKAVEHLLDRGFSEIGMITIDSEQPQMRDRLRGYHEIVELQQKEKSILTLPYRMVLAERMESIKQFLVDNPQLDALYFSTNYLCVSTLKVVQSLQKDKAYGMLSFDDHELFELLNPTVSCMRQPLEAIAKEVVTTLMTQINNPDAAFRETIIPSDLVIRHSSQ
ncbi:LacI family DNA-binding transcriptional regulator [Sphingobacterium pedocola]|uniref:LacI family transcriptional regulator n=1 Tax=Sphingobacterium pedocola TaxID=2082722 RepID=A0ABR9T3X7_9SPHI|nr:LacI family DNA-binding transcriptional regulator [Sphingobacterium pedocola]MBE8719697.1 LacI family transcriptional regulator [Sphingobacterium pedocola]